MTFSYNTKKRKRKRIKITHSELNNYDNKSAFVVKLSVVSNDSNESSSILVDKTLI